MFVFEFVFDLLLCVFGFDSVAHFVLVFDVVFEFMFVIVFGFGFVFDCVFVAMSFPLLVTFSN